MKKILTFILLLSVICSSILLSGCGNNPDAPPANNNSGTASSDIPNNTAAQSSDIHKEAIDEVASGITAAIVAKDYKTVLSLMGLDGEDSFVTEDDIAFQLPRSNFSALVDIKDSSNIEAKVVDTTKTSAYAKVYQVRDDGKPTAIVDFTLNINQDNEWIVSPDEFVNENFTFRGPSGNVTVTVNGKDITNNSAVIKKTKTGSTALCTDYTLPKVGAKTININIKSDNFDFSKELDTASNNKISNSSDAIAFYNTDDNESDAITAYIKSTWNALYNDWDSGKSATDEMQYLSDKADVDILKTIWSDFVTLTKTSKSSNKKSYENFKMDKVLINSEGHTSYLTDSIILVNFKYELHWSWPLNNSNEDMRRVSNIMLEKTKDGYKIYSVGDSKLFSMANSFTNEW